MPVFTKTAAFLTFFCILHPSFSAFPAFLPHGTFLPDLACAAGQAAWQDAVNADSETLRQAFALSAGTARMGSLSFPIDSIKQVLSAVGARFVRVDFLLSAPAQPGNFTAVLYALNEQGECLTAYYGPASSAPVSKLLGDFIIPTTLANLWLTNWKQAAQPDKPM